MSKVLKNFWVLEGLDGAGTTTQLRNIEKELSRGVRDYFITQEPTSYETGKLIRRILSGEIKATQSTIAYLFAADRDMHLNNPDDGIISQLEKGKIVVSDRYLFSSIAYQSIGFEFERTEELNRYFPYPEYIIFIDTDPEDCIKRIDSRGEKKEIYEKLDYQKKVLANYEKCFESLPRECHLVRINGAQSIEKIFEIINKKVICQKE